MIETKLAAISGKEILDVTQDAVITAADEVGQILTEVQTETEIHHDAVFYKTPEFWTGVAFVLVVLLLFKVVKKALSMLLDKRINSIVRRIDDAENLKTEARLLLAEYEEKVDNVGAEVDEILKKSKKDITAFKNKSVKEIENQITLQEKYIDERIANIKNRASAEIVNFVSEQTIKNLKIAISKELDDNQKSALIDHSIDLISNLK